MTMFSTLDDDEVEALLDGRALTDDTTLGDLSSVAHRLRTSAQREPVPPMSAALRAQVEQRSVVANRPAWAAHRSLRRGLAAAAAAAAILALVGVGAEQNRLPADVQDIVSSVADALGVEVPRADERPSQSDEEGPSSDGTSGSDDTGGDHGRQGGTTPGGATPADPGTSGDKEPATPATPPEQGNARAGAVVTPGSGAVDPIVPTRSGGASDEAGTETPEPVANPYAGGSETPTTNRTSNAGGGGGARTSTETPAATAPGHGKA
jgi:hypothetical protein